jgi:hypothetical protein
MLPVTTVATGENPQDGAVAALHHAESAADPPLVRFFPILDAPFFSFLNGQVFTSDTSSDQLLNRTCFHLPSVLALLHAPTAGVHLRYETRFNTHAETLFHSTILEHHVRCHQLLQATSLSRNLYCTCGRSSWHPVP